MPFISFKFFTAVLPLVILGYILGAFLIAFYQGQAFNPLYLGLDAIGILIGLYNFREKYLMG